MKKYHLKFPITIHSTKNTLNYIEMMFACGLAPVRSKIDILYFVRFLFFFFFQKDLGLYIGSANIKKWETSFRGDNLED